MVIKMKKAISLSVALIILLTTLPLRAFNITASAETSGIYTYTYSGSNATITRCDETASGNITIPGTINNYKVTAIAETAFAGCADITGITIPDTVTAIGTAAFANCSSLSAVKLPAKLTNIATATFSYCESLATINLPEGIVSIDENAFGDCSSLNNITLPQTVTSIGASAFSNCSSLKSINIPKNVRMIDSATFSNCGSLESVTISEGVTSIGESAFEACVSLGTISLPKTVKSIGTAAFVSCVSLTEVTMQEGTESIGIAAFANCNMLESVTLPDGLKTIGESSFNNCSSIKRITIPSSVTTIGSSAFGFCSSLTDVSLLGSVTSFGDDVFADCENIRNVYISDISDWCNFIFSYDFSNPLYFAKKFYVNNELLTDLELPGGITKVNPYLFYNCDSIKKVFIPKSVTAIAQGAFYSCGGIENVYYEGSAEDWAKITISSDNSSIKNAQINYNCNSIPKNIISITVSKLPDKTRYIENEESLNLTGGKLTVNYEGGSSYETELSAAEITGFDNSVSGKQTLTVNYNGHTTEFTVEIIEKPISFIAVASFPNKTEYIIGENADVSGGKIVVCYPEGTYIVIDMTTDMLSGFDSSTVGSKAVTVTYKGYTTQFAVLISSLPSDLDKDGKITATDITILRRFLSDSKDYIKEYDLNSDGSTDIRDLVYIKKTAI